MAVNAMTVGAGRALEVLKEGWAMQRDQGLRFSWMLHGPPGVGKTRVAEALARHVGGRLYDVRLTQVDVADLRGLPYYDHETRETRWYRPEDLPRGEAPAVLFLDELTSAAPALQPTVYGLLQERRVGLHAIPDEVFILAAGNRVEDGAVAYEMGTALSDRLIHMNVEADPAEWLRTYAVTAGLHPSVPAFLRTRPDLLETLEASIAADHMIAATPRSWERVSAIMTHVEDRRLRAIMVAGTVGEAVAAEFLPLADEIAAAVDLTALLAAPREARAKMYPDKLVALNALVYGLAGLVSDDNVEACLEVALDIGALAETRPETPAFAGLPLRELSTAGTELLIERCFALGLAGRIVAHPAWTAHVAARKAAGLS